MLLDQGRLAVSPGHAFALPAEQGTGRVRLNHGTSLPLLALAAGLVAAFGLFVLAGATPAALGLLADMSEAFPSDRGAIMGLYSVFLAVGQIVGSFIGAQAAHVAGIDGILVATLILLAVALIPLGRLRPYEHVVGTAAGSSGGLRPARSGARDTGPSTG